MKPHASARWVSETGELELRMDAGSAQALHSAIGKPWSEVLGNIKRALSHTLATEVPKPPADNTEVP